MTRDTWPKITREYDICSTCNDIFDKFRVKLSRRPARECDNTTHLPQRHIFNKCYTIYLYFLFKLVCTTFYSFLLYVFIHLLIFIYCSTNFLTCAIHICTGAVPPDAIRLQTRLSFANIHTSAVLHLRHGTPSQTYT